MKPNETRRIQLAKPERAKALALATARAETQAAYNDYVQGVLKERGVDTDATDWQYDPLTGIAVRTR